MSRAWLVYIVRPCSLIFAEITDKVITLSYRAANDFELPGLRSRMVFADAQNEFRKDDRMVCLRTTTSARVVDTASNDSRE